MKTSELKRLLRKEGCQFLRHGSRHDVWFNPKTGVSTTVPRHDSQEVRPGTCNKILKKLLGAD